MPELCGANRLINVRSFMLTLSLVNYLPIICNFSAIIMESVFSNEAPFFFSLITQLILIFLIIITLTYRESTEFSSEQ